MTIGPNLGNGHSSAIVMIEAQIALHRRRAAHDARRAGSPASTCAARCRTAWNDEVQEALQGTVWNAGGCSSYYLTADGRNSSIYPWTTIDLRRRLARFDVEAHGVRTGVREGALA